MAGHIYTVEFRIFSETIDPDTITRELGLRPCRIQLNGQLRGDGKPMSGMWAYDGEHEMGARVEWTSLEEGLTFLLNRLWPLRETIARCALSAQLIWWCGNFQTSFDGGPKLSASLLKRLGEFGAELYIDNYFPNEDEEGNE